MLQTRVLTVDPDNPDASALDEAAAVLSRGGLVAFATETVYGLGAVATNPAAVARIFEAKGRPAFNPLIVHVEGVDQARQLSTTWPRSADQLAERFWPGPLTLVLPRSGAIPDIVTAGQATVALRQPSIRVALGLIERAGPLAAPSANRSNRISPTLAQHVLADLDGRIDMVIDSGATAVGLESTVLDLTGATPRILRPGPIGVEEIERCLGTDGRIEFGPSDRARTESPASPGMLPFHYAPKTPAWRIETVDQLAALQLPRNTILLVLGDRRVPEPFESMPRFQLVNPFEAARGLYATLHQIDAIGMELLVVILPPDQPEWRAVRDRLIRATTPAPG